jgi:hypothetical protein
VSESRIEAVGVHEASYTAFVWGFVSVCGLRSRPATAEEIMSIEFGGAAICAAVDRHGGLSGG